MLAHFQAVFVVHMPKHYAVFERRLAEQQGGNRQKSIEPAAGLVNRFAYEICGKTFFEKFFVFERIVKLRERHRAGIEPAVYNVFNAVHLAAAFIAFERNLVDIRAMKFHVFNAAQLGKFFARTYNVYFAAVFAHPHG